MQCKNDDKKRERRKATYRSGQHKIQELSFANFTARSSARRWV